MPVGVSASKRYCRWCAQPLPTPQHASHGEETTRIYCGRTCAMQGVGLTPDMPPEMVVAEESIARMIEAAHHPITGAGWR